jgi:hypothetical protein
MRTGIAASAGPASSGAATSASSSTTSSARLSGTARRRVARHRHFDRRGGCGQRGFGLGAADTRQLGRVDHHVIGPQLGGRGRRHRPHIIAHQFVQRGLAQRVLRLLLVADIIVAPRRHRPLLGRRAHDGGPDEDHQIGLVALPAARAEQIADQRQVAQQRNLLDRAPLILVEQPADHRDLAILDHERILALALVEDEILAARRRRPGDRAHLDPQVHLDRPAGIHLRPHLQGDADILALHGAKRIVEIGAQRLAGGDRDFLADQEARFLVVEREGRRDRQQVRRIVRPHRIEDRAEQGVACPDAEPRNAARNA